MLRTDDLIHQALARRPRRVLTNSHFLIEQAHAAGLDVAGWRPVPNALLIPGQPPGATERERLRQGGPVRVVARAEPHKGVAELIGACPQNLDRELEIVLAPASFEYWVGMQAQVIADCRRLAEAHPRARMLPALPWRQVQPFLAGAAATIIASTSPETFCLTALEALSVATPVCSFDLVVAPARDGFVEQIDHHVTGLFYGPGRAEALTTAITHALDLDITRMRHAAATRVRAERDIAVNLPRTLAFFWAIG